MIIKQLVPIYETVEVKRFLRNSLYIDQIKEYLIIRREVDHVYEFTEYYTEEGEIDPNVCLLKIEEGWIEVSHTFEELLKMKTRKPIKGYG